ncbi:hypothetical protein [Lysobacter fragariae]
MTITIGFWAIPVAVVVVAIVLAFLFDDDLRNGNGGFLAGCFGMMIILVGIVLAGGLVLGRLLS